MIVRSVTLAVSALLTWLAPPSLGPGPAFAAGGEISGVVLQSRSNASGETSLLVTVQGTLGGRVVDAIDVDLPRDAEGQAKPGKLPPGWTLTLDGRTAKLTGPPLAEGGEVFLRLDFGRAQLPRTAKVAVFSGGMRVFSDKVPVATLPPLRVASTLDGILTLPPVVSPGETIEVELLDPQRTPPAGRWTIAGTTADVVREPVGGGRSARPRLRVPLPTSLNPGDAIGVTYSDPWDEAVVHVPRADGCTVTAPPAASPDTPEITASTPMSFPGEAICVCGWFPDASTSRAITLDGEPLGAPVSAARQVVQVRLPEGIEPGAHVVAGAPSAGFPDSNRAEVVVLVVGGEIDRQKILRGESTPMRLWVKGTEEAVSLRLENRTPEIITIEGGVSQVVSTSGGTPNSLTRKVKGIRVGDFNISYTLEAAVCPCLEIAREREGSAPGPALPTSCDEIDDDCERLRREANEAVIAAAQALHAAEAAEHELVHADSLDEEIARKQEEVATRRKQASAYRELARAAEEAARLDRERATRETGGQWDKQVQRDEEEAARRHREADGHEAKAAALEKEVRTQGEEATEIRKAAADARREAEAKKAAADTACAAYDDCVRRLKECERIASATESEPAREDEPGVKVCGPDITEYVFAVLDEIMEDFYKASPKARRRACWSPIDPATYADAWDITPLDPGSAPPPGAKPEVKGWFEAISDACATPKSPCAPTAEFLGHCIHSQVINYVQWGLMNRLCEDEDIGAALNWGRTVFLSHGVHYDGQRMMRRIGSEFVDLSKRTFSDPNVVNDPGTYTQKKINEIRELALRSSIERWTVFDGETSDWSTRDAAQCQTICELTPEQEERLRSLRWSYKWTGLRMARPR